MLSPLLKNASLPAGSPGSSRAGVSPSTPLAAQRSMQSKPPPIGRLPDELLAHCFALLPAGALLAATLVCRAWQHVATDELSWKSAFENYYGVEKGTPGRRLDQASWRNEYLLRTRLSRRWVKSRNAPIAFDAHAGPISDLVVSMTDAMTVSASSAAASRSDPLTGRILRTNIHPDVVAGQITCAKANEKGQTIAWGLRDGQVRVSLVCAPVSRPLTLVHLGSDATKHSGPVTCISFAPFPNATTPAKCTFATTATDGLVKIWDAEATDTAQACLFTSSTVDRMRRTDGDIDVGLSLSYAPSYRVVAVGTEGGALHVWRLDGQWSTRAYIRIAPKGDTIAPIAHVSLDASPSATDISVLVKRMGASTFERYWPFVEPERAPLIYKDQAGTALTAIAADLAPAKTNGKEVITGFGSLKYVATGDDEGTVALWLWDPFEGAAPAKTMSPSKILQKKAGGLATVTALALSDLLVFVGSIDGTIKAYDPLTGQVLRALSDRANPRQAVRALAAGLGTPEERERYAITHLRASRGAIVAAAGNKVLAWHIEDQKGKSKKRKLRLSTSVRNSQNRMDRLSNDREMQQDVYEIRQQLRDEQEARVERASENARLRLVNGDGTLGLSEDEAIAYAMMISSEEADADALADDMAALSFDFDEPRGRDEDQTAVFTPARSPLQTSLLSSRASSRSSSASLTDYGDEIPEEEEDEQDFASFVGSPSSITSNRYFPLSPRMRPQNVPDLADDLAWPSPSPRSPLLSPTHASRLSPVPTPPPASQRSFSDAARAGLSSSVESPRSLSFSHSPAPSPSLRPVRHPASADADLQFAIELSLAEARSRLDQGSV